MKTIKKARLGLARETLVELKADALARIAGGAAAGMPPSLLGYCPKTHEFRCD
jgi:hypothetical protein